VADICDWRSGGLPDERLAGEINSLGRVDFGSSRSTHG
jgi:hypothetical protein